LSQRTMRFDVITLFPELFGPHLTQGITRRAFESGQVDVRLWPLRDFAQDNYRRVDDRPFGGGPGMVMKVEPVCAALKSVGAVRARRVRKSKNRPFVVYLSPQGKTLNQSLLHELAEHRHLILLCGHYEGVDERILGWVDQEVSIGDYVLTGGELPAMVLIDSVARLLPGVVKENASVQGDSFYNGLLDYPHYTRPLKADGVSVPDVLLSGHHVRVAQWRREQSLARTLARRPDLIKKAALTAEDKKYLVKLGKRKTIPA